MDKIIEKQGVSRLNPDQKRAATASPEKPLLIVAGAGTGKTATLTQRVAYFIEEGIPGSAICAITFTNKAAKEMEQRIAGMGKAGFIGTFHAFGARILRKHAALLGRTPGFVIFDNHDSFSLIKKILKDLDKKKENPASMAGKISDFKNNGVDLEKEPPLFQVVFTRYENSLQAQNAFDFDDLLSKTVLLFKKVPAVLLKYREQFTHILIDEYQDLNDIQYELIRLLIGDRASISVVGDAEQTIYGWRGSNIEIFLRFPEDWAEATMVTLTQNYRSTQNILRAAAGVISQNEYDTKIERATNLWTENVLGKPVTIYETLDEDTEAMWIAEHIYKNREENHSTAILYRTNAQSRAIEQALLRRRIPYRVYGGLKFYERREIKDIVAALRYSLNNQDEIAKDRLEKTFSKRMFKTLAAEFQSHPDESPLGRIELFMKTVGYLEYIESHLTNPRERRENIEELIHFASSYKDIAQFLEEIALLQSTDNMANSKGVDREVAESGSEISLTTIHLAKGLEFDRVFVIGCAEGLLPHARSLDTKLELQEERRLMYVAMTRARKELFLTFYGLPSRFLGEIPAEATEFKSAMSNDAALDYRDEEYEERYITLD